MTDYSELKEHLRYWANDPMWADHAEVPKRALTAALAAIEALERREAEARGVVEPFAAELRWWKPHVTDEARIAGTTLTVGNLRRARRWLEGGAS